MNDALEILNELQKIVDGTNVSGLIESNHIQDFIDNQQSIYGEVSGECAA